MKPVLRCGIPVLMAALALANTGCGSKSSELSPTSPTGVRPPAAPIEAQGVTSMAVAPPLGAAASFGLLAGPTATNTGASTLVTGDLGVSPGNTDPGFTAANVTGTIHLGDATAAAAQAADTTAYLALAGQACNVTLTGTDLGGLTLTPGVYCFSSSAQLTGTLTLNGLGNAGSVWVFQIGSTLTTASGSRVSFINSGQACGAFWQVGSSATLGTGTAFAGNILALTAITMNTNATNAGAVFAQNAAVTLDHNQVSVVGSCGSGPQPSPTPLPPPVPTLPEAATWGLLVILLASGAFVLGRR
jgi:hypothetical protein